MILKRKNIVRFTTGNGIKASDEQLQGKKIPFKVGEELTIRLTMNWRDEADKKAELFPLRMAGLWQGHYRDCDLSSGWVAAPFSCFPALGFYVSSVPLPSRLCTTLPGKRRIILALLQHFLHDSSCQIPFQGCVGWVCSMCSVISQLRTSLHIQAHRNPLNKILLS